MALSDVTVSVNLATSVGTEPIWFPLFLAGGASSEAQPLAKLNSLDYAEFATLQEFVDAVAPYADTDTRQERKAKQEEVRKSGIYKALEFMCQQSGHPSHFAVILRPTTKTSLYEDLKAEVEKNLDAGWRQLVPSEGVVTNDKIGFQFAEYIENLEQRKLLFLSATSSVSASYTDEDTGKTYTLADYTRTISVYHPSNAVGEVTAAVIGATAGKTPGSLNYRNVIVNGVAPVSLTETEVETLHTSGFMTLVERAGDTVTSTGKSASGERYIDTIDIEDYVVQKLVYMTQKALNANDVVPYSNEGISILENAAVSVMSEAASSGMIAKTDANTYEYDVNYPAISYVPNDDIANRIYKLGTVSFTVQGAVDKVEIAVDMAM